MEQLQNYCLRWNSYQTNLVRVFEEMLKNENFTDVTIVTENGAKFKCHKMILAACSKFFQDIFTNVPSEQHLVVLLKDVKANDMSHILEYMYTGQVNVEQSRLTSIIRTAEELQIKGLTGDEKLTKTEEEQMEEHPSRPSSNHVPTVVQSSSMHSPPHSTNSMYKNPYSNMYSKMHPNDRANMNLPMWHVPGLPMSHAPTLDTSPSNRFSGPSPPMMPAYEQPPAEVYHHRRKKFSSNMMPKDTPILRTVLGQGQDLSQPVSLVVNHGDIKQEHVENERKHMKEEILDDTLSPYSDHHSTNGEEVKSEKAISAQSFPNDMRKISSDIAKYVPVEKPEWKRYKQYSRASLNCAIQAVAHEKMSALEAAKLYNVPSRTLYDKIKKLGIVTRRGIKRRGNFRHNMMERSTDSPYTISENDESPINNNTTTSSPKAFDYQGESALDAMAFVAYQMASQNGSQPLKFDQAASPALLQYIQQRLQSRSPPVDERQYSQGFHVEQKKDTDPDENQVEDLSLNKRPDVIVSPMQVSAIVKTEDIKPEEIPRETNEEPRREMCVTN